jgi:DNA repair exonuclease SbcCD ATPase subunit
MSEPTTENIAKALRVCFEKTCACSECPFEHEDCGDIEQLAADRLESQAREIERLKEELEQIEEAATVLHAANETHWTYIKEQTARAEKAEKNRDIWEKKWLEEALKKVEAQWERDALISSIERLRTKKIELCSICEFEDLIACCHKNHCDGYQLFKWRGLPQEGEGK